MDANIPPALSQRILWFQKQGIIVPDSSKAAFYIDRIGWFRLGAYALGFVDCVAQHPSSVCFDDVLELYRFDRELRLMCLNASERIEMSVKSYLLDYLFSTHGAEWYKRADVFGGDAELQAKIIGKSARVTRNPLEIWDHITFGETSKLYNLMPSSIRKEIAGRYCKYTGDQGLYPEVFGVWLKAISLVRNRAAHHNRIWNETFAERIAIPAFIKNNAKSEILPPKWAQRFYSRALIIFYLIDRIARNTLWHERLKQLIKNSKHVTLNIEEEMGFPAGWDETPFWNPPRILGAGPLE